MMSGEKNKPYMSLKSLHGLMDCRIKSGNDNRVYVKRRITLGVMPSLVPGIHVLTHCRISKTWMAGTSPAMADDIFLGCGG